MSLASLPVELLDAICEPLASSASTLASLALTCAIANPSATRMLYRAVAVSAYAGNLSVVHTLATRTDLAQLVREFSITLDDANVPFRAFYVQLQIALQGMPQLTSLELHINSGASWVLSGLDNSSCLEHFSCSFPLDAHVTAFLSGTPALRSLQISDPAPPASTDVLPQNYVPRLESYTGPASLLPLLASRPLTTIYLTGDLKIEDIPQCSGAPAMRETDSQMNAYSYPAPENSDIDVHTKTHQVHVFSAVTSAPPVLLLEALALAYPSMVCLRLMTTYAFWEAPDMALYTRIAATLASLSSLSVFELSGMHWESRPKSVSAFSSAADGAQKEWISPPVTPRGFELHMEAEDVVEDQNNDLGFGENFFDWSY